MSDTISKEVEFKICHICKKKAENILEIGFDVYCEACVSVELDEILSEMAKIEESELEEI